MKPPFPDVFSNVGRSALSRAKRAEKKKKIRNDRIIAVEKDAHSWADIKTIGDLGKQFVRELEEFFVDYHRLSGKQYRVLDRKGRQPGTKTGQSRVWHKRHDLP